MLRDRAEGAAAKAAAHDVDRGADHLPRRDLGRPFVAAGLIGIGRVRAARIGQAKHPVHFGGGQRDGRRVHPHIAGRGAFPMGLHQCPGVARVGFQVQHAVGVGVENRVALHLFKAGQAQHGTVARRHLGFVTQRQVGHKLQRLHIRQRWRAWAGSACSGAASGCGRRCISTLLFRILLRAALALGLRLLAGGHVRVDVGLDLTGLVDSGGIHLEPALFRRAAEKRGAAHIGDVLNWLPRSDAVGHFDQRTFGIAIEQDVALAVHHDGAAHLVAPVVVVGNAPQRAFDTAQNNGHILVGFTAALAVDDGRAVGALATHVARGVGVVGADLAVSRITVDHRVHVARRHTPKQIGLAQGLEGIGTVPIGLCNDADTKALGFQHTADDGHAKARVVHIRVAGDQDDVAAVPAQLVHLGTAHRQKWRRAKALGPVRLVAGQRLGSTFKKRDINRGRHGQQQSWSNARGARCQRWQGPIF